MEFTRRDLLKFTSGGMAGLVFTPAPWKLLKDSSLVSENWPGVPQPKQAEMHTRYTTCTLCPAGCGVCARCVGDQPVSLAGVPGHPAGRGALCANGLLGHHLPFCAGRARRVLAGGRPSPVDDVVARVRAAIAQRGPREPVAILDARPGRVASQIYRQFLQKAGQGIYCAPAGSQPYGPFGIDLENTRAILSFGVPVLDGWLSPGRVLQNRGHFQLIQVEATRSRTASLADLWISIPASAEADFMAAVACALQGGAADARAMGVARLLQANQPAIVIGAGAGKLNALLGNAGRPGGFLLRRDYAPAADLSDVPDGSISVLLAEETALPWALLQRKLAPRATVVALTSWLDGYAQHADFVVPAPLYLECLDEVPTPAGATAAGFSLSPPLIPGLAGTMAPPEFVLRLAGDSTAYPDLLKQRVTALRKEGRGSVFSYADAKSTRVRDLSSGDDIWKLMLGGAAWTDDPLPQRSAGPPLFAAEWNLKLRKTPLMSKLYQESGLRS